MASKRKGHSVAFVARDVFGIVDGAGWVILDGKGKRVDWPMMKTEAEARSELRGFGRSVRELERDETSEALGLSLMNRLNPA